VHSELAVAILSHDHKREKVYESNASYPRVVVVAFFGVVGEMTNEKEGKQHAIPPIST
jgi:hypothetical protein